jgi:hypothetical protein
MSTPSRDPEEGPDSQHVPSSEPAGAPDTEAPAGTPVPGAPAANEPAETRFDTPVVTDHEDTAAHEDTVAHEDAAAHEDTAVEREPSGALAPEEMAFVPDGEEPASDTPAADQTLSDIPAVTEPAAAGTPRFDTLGPEEPAYDTLGAGEPEFDTFAPESPEVAEAVREAEPNWPPLVRRMTLGQAIVMVTGVLLFIWGFLPWYSDAGGSANAWSTETIPGLLLTATWVPLLSLAIVVFIAIKVFGNGFPDSVLGFSWAQLAIVVGFIDVLISLGFLVANRSLGSLGSLDLGPGLILSFITSLVLLAGAVLDHLGRGSDFFRGGGQRRVASPGAGGPAAPAPPAA